MLTRRVPDDERVYPLECLLLRLDRLLIAFDRDVEDLVLCFMIAGLEFRLDVLLFISEEAVDLVFLASSPLRTELALLVAARLPSSQEWFLEVMAVRRVSEEVRVRLIAVLCGVRSARALLMELLELRSLEPIILVLVGLRAATDRLVKDLRFRGV